MLINYLLLALSVSLSAARNAISKKTALSTNKSYSDFFFSQTVLFLFATILLAVVNGNLITKISNITVIYGIIYGVLLILSQWMLTLSLKSGDTSICSTVYSLGFILPTLSGTLFWNEPFFTKDAIGLVLVLAVIALSVKAKPQSKKSGSFVPFIIIAMVASGGLGIMQKVQQTSNAPEEKGAFLIIAFSVATLFSLVFFLCCKKKNKPSYSSVIYPAITGSCFGGANLCNTILAGQMKSSVVFPLQNISTILLSTLLGIFIFREKITPKIAIMIILSVVAVIIFSF